MPELPDVEIFKRYFEKKALNHKIKNIEVLSSLTLEKKNSKSLTQFKNASFKRVYRHGKHLIVESSKGTCIAMHFGMTGFLYDYTAENPYVKFARVLFHFDNGHTLAFTDARLLGRVSACDSIETYMKKKRLGPDALEISFEQFKHIFRGIGKVKSTLLDQHKMAGVGNVYADEILFQAKIHPKSQNKKLKDSEIKELYKCMQSVLKKAIKVGADVDKMPTSWLLPRRKAKERCPRCKMGLEKTSVIQRPTYFCPHCQLKN